MSDVTAPMYSEKNLEVPDGLIIMSLYSASMLFYPCSLNFCNCEFNHITMCYVLHSFVWPKSVKTRYYLISSKILY